MKGFTTITTTTAHLYYPLRSLSVKELQGDMGSVPGSGRSPGEGNGNPRKSRGQRSLVGYDP